MAQVIGRVEPEPQPEYLRRRLEPPQPPEAESITVEAAEKRAIVDNTPGQYTAEIGPQGEFADPDPDLLVADRPVGTTVEF